MPMLADWTQRVDSIAVCCLHPIGTKAGPRRGKTKVVGRGENLIKMFLKILVVFDDD